MADLKKKLYENSLTLRKQISSPKKFFDEAFCYNAMCTTKTLEVHSLCRCGRISLMTLKFILLLPNLTNKNMGKVLHVISEAKWPMTPII